MAEIFEVFGLMPGTCALALALNYSKIQVVQLTYTYYIHVNTYVMARVNRFRYGITEASSGNDD